MSRGISGARETYHGRGDAGVTDQKVAICRTRNAHKGGHLDSAVPAPPWTCDGGGAVMLWGICDLDGDPAARFIRTRKRSDEGEGWSLWNASEDAGIGARAPAATVLIMKRMRLERDEGSMK